MSEPGEDSSGLLARHLSFLEALRAAGLSVSLAEGLDAVDALGAIGWRDRDVVHDTYAATLLKRHAQRPTFDALFDLYFPRMIGGGVAERAREAGADGEPDGSGSTAADDTTRARPAGARDNAAALTDFRERLAAALADGEARTLAALAAEAVGRFGAMPGRGPGLSSWSAYTALQRVAPSELVDRVVRGLLDGVADQAASADADGALADARRRAGRRVGDFTRRVEDDARRRIAEEKGPDHVADVAVRPSLDQLAFTSARRADLEDLRREIYPLARRLAARLTQEHHARRRGPLDVRRTVRASMSTGGVPLTTHHRPRRPHRTELVVLCDVSGSVASFAQFTLMLVFALREQFTAVRAFTFVDTVHEVTHHFTPGGDLVDTLAALAADTVQAATWGRTSYGRALTAFAERHGDAVGSKTSLLVLGDARSNYGDLALPVLGDLVDTARHAWWLNPEQRRHWGTGDSATAAYGAVVPMVECRNLAQLGDFVRRLAD